MGRCRVSHYRNGGYFVAKLQELKIYALEVAGKKGHKLGLWKKVEMSDKIRESRCVLCFRVVYINTFPGPHQSNIMGNACDEKCETKREDKVLI